MKLKIKVHANSSKEEIKKLEDRSFEFWLKEKAVDGKANLKLVKVLKKYFGCDVKIVSGFASRVKWIEVLE